VDARILTLPSINSPLYIDYCEYQAAKYAAENWHYSECLPPIKNVYFGVWEHGDFVGSVVYSRPASASMGDIFDLSADEFAELSRVALRDHENEVSRIVSITISMLEKKDSGLDCLFSYADPVEDHYGGIYQAMNWIYIGRTEPSRVGVRNGEQFHSRTISRKVEMGHMTRGEVNQEFTFKKTPGKHKYVYPLDDDVRDRAESMQKPYPKEP
jgi:hypothetical protein